MLREFVQATGSEEEFLASYEPVRKQFEKFLNDGKKIEGNLLQRASAAIYLANFGRCEFPYYERQVDTLVQGSATPVHIKVKTEGHLYPFSRSIGGSYILIKVTGENPNKGSVAVLPPLRAFKHAEIDWKDWSDITSRVADISATISR